ncbi:MAG: hypothetical protein ACLVB1_04805 [Blautia obeum]
MASGNGCLSFRLCLKDCLLGLVEAQAAGLPYFERQNRFHDKDY